ncbi:MAG: class I adenylate-forming enzyme family protein [Acidimicrobiia bacterium]
MDHTTPAGWIDRWADADFDRPALVLDGAIVSYGHLATETAARARTLRGVVSAGEVVPVLVDLDLPSIVDLFAHMAVGAVPLPRGESRPDLDGQRADGAVVCLSTSGTSGVSRLVPLTMANLTAALEASRARLGTGEDDRWLACLPLTHIGGLSVLFRSFEAGGAAVVGPFGDSTPALIERMRPTVASLVPTMVHRLVETDPAAIASIGVVLVGGASLSESLSVRARSVGVNLVPTYGMTETSSQVATRSPDEAGGPEPGSVGRPLDGFTVSIGSPPGGGPGRIIVDGPAVFSGYMGEDARTGPFTTNDIGVVAPDGSLTVLGRADDVVISGGENVSLSSVREALNSVAEVDDAVVVGVDDDEWGVAVCALVVSPSLGAAQERAVDVLAAHEVPKRWASTDRIPLLPNGKVDVEAVRSHFQA